MPPLSPDATPNDGAASPTVPAMTSARSIVVLGSTGSIGTQTLDVCRQHRDKVSVRALAAFSNTALLLEQALEFGVSDVAVGDAGHLDDPAVTEMREHGISVSFGQGACAQLAEIDGADCVVNAFVGAAGLEASYRVLASGRRLALANKESLVVGGDLLMPLAEHAELLPVDSEHGAIYQCLIGERRDEVERLWVTCSGGPFRGMDRERLSRMTRDEALAHPTWKMGPKITVDSATLMNKGLEVIEAHHLFGMGFDRISVVVHPQSCIHSMVAYRDGSVKAHLGVTDMRIPIQYALSYPDRWDGPAGGIDFTTLADLTFSSPDTETFRCLALALRAGAMGGTAPCALNAANEVAVAAFLNRECAITDIDRVVEKVLDDHEPDAVASLEQLADVDRSSRAKAREVLDTLTRGRA